MDHFYKLCFLGDSGVGKTTLIQRYLTGSFSANTLRTLGIQFDVKVLVVDGERVTLQIWDFSGEDRFRFILPSYCLQANGAVFLYDITSPHSLLVMRDWLNLLWATAGKVPVLLAGTKKDLESQRKITPSKAMELGKTQEITGFMETSAKTGENIEFLFEKISRMLIVQKKTSKVR